MKLLTLEPGMDPELCSLLLDRISRIDSEVFQDSRWGRDAFSENVTNDYDFLTAAVSDDPDPKVFGYGLLRLFDDAELIMTAVDPEYRKRGIGRSLLNCMITEAKQRKTAGIFLEVRESNLPARAMYRSAGFTEEGIRRGYSHAPAEDAVIMRYIC